MDDATRTKEQQGFKEGVCEEVEHRRAVGRHARREEHVTELGTGRISDHALNIVLREPHGVAKENTVDAPTTVTTIKAVSENSNIGERR